MTDFDQIFNFAASRADFFPRKKTIQRLSDLVNYSTTDQQELDNVKIT